MVSIAIPLAFLVSVTLLICHSDFRWNVIPNWVNGGLYLGGIALQMANGWTAILTALAGSLLVASVLVAFRFAHRRYTGRYGLGLGDVKFCAAAAVWINALDYPAFLMISSILALLYFLLRYGRRYPASRELRLPFGPFLSFGLVLVWCLEHFDLTSSFNGGGL